MRCSCGSTSPAWYEMSPDGLVATQVCFDCAPGKIKAQGTQKNDSGVDSEVTDNINAAGY